MKYPYYQETKKVRFISSDKIVPYIIGGLTVAALVFITAFAFKEQKQKAVNVASFAATDQEKPKAEASSDFFDLGIMKVSEEKGSKFTIENKGSKALQIYNITSSCGCTVAKVTLGGKVSPEFGMHTKSTWSGEIAPGQSASVEVIYRPFVMPVKGEVTRAVYVSTNDPDNPLLTFTVKANVQ